MATLQTSATQRHWLLLGLVLIVGLFLRTVVLGVQPLWYDEALTLVLSQWSGWEMLTLPTDATAGLYYFLHRLFLQADDSAATVRLISVVAGMGSIGAAYVLGALAFNRVGGLLTAALLAVWPMHVEYSQEARAYSLLFLLALLAGIGFLLFARGLRRGSIWNANLGLILFGSANVLMFYTHLSGVPWIAASSVALVTVAVVGWGRAPLARIALLFAAMGLLAVPGLRWYLLHYQVGDTFVWLTQPTPQRFVRILTEVLLPKGAWENPWAVGHGLQTPLAYVTFAVCLGLLATAVFISRARLRELFHGRLDAAAVIVSYLTVPLVLWLVGFFKPMILTRTVLLSIPGWILLLVAICLAIPSRRWAGAAGVGMIAAYLASTVAVGVVPPKEDWVGAYHAISGAAKKGDIVILCDETYPALRHAAGQGGGPTIMLEGGGRRDLLEIEAPLGSNPRWEDAFFRAVSVRVLTDRLGGAPPISTSPKMELKTYTLSPGAAIFRQLGGHCRANLKVGFDQSILPSRQIWSTKTGGGFEVRRYMVEKPLTFTVERIAAQ